MKWLLSVLIISSLTSSSLSYLNFENLLLNEKWLLIESKSGSMQHQFTNKDVRAQNENLKTSLVFKENGVLIEKHGPETNNPFFISGWKFIGEGSKQFLKISNSRQWNGQYEIDQLDKHHLRLIKK